MAEVVGLVASVVQLAGAGLKLSQALYQYADGVATADRRIKKIAKDVELTSLVVQELGEIFKKDETANLISVNAVKTANETIKECSEVFKDIQVILDKSRLGKMGRLLLPFRDNKIELLRSQLDKLKSTLELLMQVLMHAQLVSSNKLNREAEAKQREEIKQLLENKKQSTKKYEESLRNFSISDSSTAVDDEERSLQEEEGSISSSDLFKTASAIGSTISPDTLATCVNHVRGLLADIEILQHALAKKVDGDDRSDYHQKAIGSYFVARSHLDSVLLGNSRANITGVQTQQLIKAPSTINTTSDPQRIVVAGTTSERPPENHSSTASRVEKSEAEMKRVHARDVAAAEEKAKIEHEKNCQKSGGINLEDAKRAARKEREARLLVEQEVYREREAQERRKMGPTGAETVRQKHPPVAIERFGQNQPTHYVQHYSTCNPSTSGSESYKRPPPPSISISQLPRDYNRSPPGPYLIEERRPLASSGTQDRPLLLGPSLGRERSQYSSRPLDFKEEPVSNPAPIERERKPYSAAPHGQLQSVSSRTKERAETDADNREKARAEARVGAEEKAREKKRAEARERKRRSEKEKQQGKQQEEEKGKMLSRRSWSFGLTAKQKHDQKELLRAEKRQSRYTLELKPCGTQRCRISCSSAVQP
jgi:hypothetical protein